MEAAAGIEPPGPPKNNPELKQAIEDPQVLPFSLEQIQNMEWQQHSENPVIKSTLAKDFGYLADPTVITPDQTQGLDKKYHLIAPSGQNLKEFTSKDGVQWDEVIRTKPFVENGCRPFIYKEKDTFYLFYTKIDNFKLHEDVLETHIEMMSSKDLHTWTESKPILRPTDLRHEKVVGNPSVVKVGNKYRMYVSCGKLLQDDCLFTEPKDIWIAESDTIDGEYAFSTGPVIAHSKDDPYMNQGAGSIKVYKTTEKDGTHKFIGFENGIYKKERSKMKLSLIQQLIRVLSRKVHPSSEVRLSDEWETTSAIRILSSDDGITWKSLTEPIVLPNPKLGEQYAYACDVKAINGELHMYYNTRKPIIGNIIGQENISLAYGRLQPQVPDNIA